MARELKRYRRVSLQMWGDKKFRELSKPSPSARELWLFLITGPHTSAIPGLLHVGQAGLSESLAWSLPALRRCWQEIADKEMGEADWNAPLIWLPNALKHNPPESLNVVKSWATTFDTLPECELKAKAEAYVQAFLQAKGQGFAEAFGLGMVHTETGTETGSGTETGTALPKHPVRELLSVHDQQFQAKYQSKPSRYTGREAKQAETLIAQHGYERACAIVKRAFISTDPFISKSGHSLGVIVSSTVQNKLIAELVAARKPAMPAAVPHSLRVIDEMEAKRMQADLRAWPKNLEAERSVLGGILIENETIDDALPLITAQSFHDPANGVIFGRMVALRDKKIPIDLTTLYEHLGRHDELEKAKGAAYVASLVDGVPRSTNVAFYANIVREKATLRALIRTAHVIANAAFEGSDDADEILNQAEAAVMSVAQTAVRGDFVHVSELVQRASRRFVEAHDNPRIVTGLPTSITALDKMLRGFQPGDVIYLAAGSSRGKSALMMQMAQAIALHDVCGIVSLEMSADALVDRAVAQVAGVDAFRMKTGHLTAYEQNKCGQAFEILTNSNLYIDDVVGLTATQMRSKVRRFASRKKLKALFIDYAQLMTDGGKFSTRNEEIAAISRGWKLLAIELNIPIVILSQLSREGTKQDDERPPTLAHLRDSGALEQDADVVLLIWRHTEGGEKVVDLIVAKQRNGPTGLIRLKWFAEQMRFASPDDVIDEVKQPEMAL